MNHVFVALPFSRQSGSRLLGASCLRDSAGAGTRRPPPVDLQLLGLQQATGPLPDPSLNNPFWNNPALNAWAFRNEARLFGYSPYPIYGAVNNGGGTYGGLNNPNAIGYGAYPGYGALQPLREGVRCLPQLRLWSVVQPLHKSLRSLPRLRLWSDVQPLHEGLRVLPWLRLWTDI